MVWPTSPGGRILNAHNLRRSTVIPHLGHCKSWKLLAKRTQCRFALITVDRPEASMNWLTLFDTVRVPALGADQWRGISQAAAWKGMSMPDGCVSVGRVGRVHSSARRRGPSLPEEAARMESIPISGLGIAGPHNAEHRQRRDRRYYLVRTGVWDAAAIEEPRSYNRRTSTVLIDGQRGHGCEERSITS